MTLSVRLNTLLINSFNMNISAVIAPQIYKFFQIVKKICSLTTCFFVFIFVEILSENVSIFSVH